MNGLNQIFNAMTSNEFKKCIVQGGWFFCNCFYSNKYDWPFDGRRLNRRVATLSATFIIVRTLYNIKARSYETS